MTAGIEFIRNEMDWDKYDPWGSVMSALFDVCEGWWAATGEQLNDYHPSVWLVAAKKAEKITVEMGERPRRIRHAVLTGIISEKDVQYWLKVLNRMRELVILAGRDY